MLVGTAIDGDTHQAAHDARKGAFHSGDDDDDAGGVQPVPFTKQTVDACDADIVEAIDDISHQFGGDRRLFRDRQIRRPGAGDEHGAATGRDVTGRDA